MYRGEREDGEGLDPFTASALGLLTEGQLSSKNINMRNRDGWTMLMYSCYYNKLDLVMLLISYGADPGISCKRGRNAMMIATVNGNIDILKLVSRDDLINTADFYGMTPLWAALEYGNDEVTAFLLSKGANPNIFLNEETCLMYAAAKGNYSLVKLLLRSGADVHLTNHEGMRAKDIANERGYSDIVSLIKAFEEASIEPVLKFLGFEEYLPLFMGNCMSFNEFLNLTENDMQVMGINIFGRRRRLAMFLQEIRDCYEGLL